MLWWRFFDWLAVVSWWTLLLVFLLFPIAARYRNRLMWWDVVCAALGVATIVYLLAGGDDIWDRNTLPSRTDIFFGVSFVLLVLEAVRRTSGWIMLFVVSLFLAYAFVGPWLPGQWAHRGYDVASMSGFLYQTLEGIFGTAVDVSSTSSIDPSARSKCAAADSKARSASARSPARRANPAALTGSPASAPSP